MFIADDAGNANVTQNSQNFGFAFFQSFLGSSYGTANNFDGPAEFDIILEASRGANVLATNHIVIDVVESNDAPVAQDDTAAVTEDVTLGASGNVLTNDLDDDAGDSKSVTTTGTFNGAHGDLLTLNANGTYAYALNNGATNVQQLGAGDTASDTFSYTMKDLDGAINSADLVVTITGTNDVVVAVDDTTSTDNDTLVNIDVLDNDTDVDIGDVHTITQIDGNAISVGNSVTVAGGSVTLNADRTSDVQPR